MAFTGRNEGADLIIKLYDWVTRPLGLGEELGNHIGGEEAKVAGTLREKVSKIA